MRTAYNIHQDPDIVTTPTTDLVGWCESCGVKPVTYRVHSENAFSRMGGALDVCGGCVQYTISRAFEESGDDTSPIVVEESV